MYINIRLILIMSISDYILKSYHCLRDCLDEYMDVLHLGDFIKVATFRNL